MNFTIRHELKNRIRLHLPMKRLSFMEADIFEYYLRGFDEIGEVRVYERTADAVIFFDCDRSRVTELVKDFSFEDVQVPERVFECSGRELSAGYYEKVVTTVILHYARRLILPFSIRRWLDIVKTVGYIWRGLKTLGNRRLQVELLDATAITAAVLTGDYNTASNVMFLLKIGDTLEEWTHKRSVDDLARRMSLNIDRVWLLTDNGEVQTDASAIECGDRVVVRMGNMIPFDGEIVSGEAMVNQASMTGESTAIHKGCGMSVFAGTVVEEGDLTVRVTQTEGCGRFDKIVKMIEESEKLKSSLESKAERIADRLVPYTLLAAGLTWAISRNVTKAVSVLMVDYSCALKMAMPISVLSAIKEAAEYDITVKGGKFLEAVADADTIVFDKTGTITKAKPTVAKVVSFCDESEDELLRQAACLEEHFPHSVARAVVDAASEKGLLHDELHTNVEYIVAHGIASEIEDERAVIGSYHFVFEDEGAVIADDRRELFDSLPDGYSHLYFAKNGKLSACILIEDPMRKETPDVVRRLCEQGFEHIVMMTGDSERTAAVIAAQAGITEYYSEVLPEDKSGYVEKMKKEGHRVIMVGDGINDSPALSASDAGIAISDGAEIARQIADITIGSDDLESIAVLREISTLLMKRIRFNYRTIVGFNTALIGLGIAGVMPPATSAMLHNGSTVAIGLKSMTHLLGAKDNISEVTENG
ncbi:ATPase, P-type (transporting), HAD superfamily, subfamily IC/heavy metal translocating P-type ATPase [Lachnospiraceae bacterium XBB2008]|nr:ATPase, P-type (transporting), HAD superfamily, subfamily IC/heavy metal translocating P-type ATPase [Lachnospiraceae bacterium XBB2008]